MKTMYDNLIEFNARKFARLPVDAFIKTMVLAVVGFSVIYSVIIASIYGGMPNATDSYPVLRIYLSGLAIIGLSWLPFSIIKTTIQMMPQIPFKIVLKKRKMNNEIRTQRP